MHNTQEASAMKNSLAMLIPFAALTLGACHISANAEDKRLTSDGKAITTSAATIGAFTKIEGVGPDNIVFVTGDSFSIKAEGDADQLKKLRYALDNGTILIGREKGEWWGNNSKGVTVTVTAPALATASLAGSGNFTADRMTGDKVAVEIAGSGDAKIANVSAKSFSGEIAGSGNVTVAGKVDSAKLEVAGSGDIDAASLQSVDGNVDIAGSGDVTLTASGAVKADIAGSGNVTVKGGAKCSSSVMGSGKLTCG
jgi:Putative auto-transporter adhesin, head GIN domain